MRTMKEKKDVAVKYLDILVNNGVLDYVKRDFVKDDTIYYSENGILFYLDERNNHIPGMVLDKIKELQNAGVVVFHATHEVTDFGELYDLWCVTDEDVDYENDSIERFKDGLIFSYVVNITVPWYSEFGTIGYRTLFGGCQRIS